MEPSQCRLGGIIGFGAALVLTDHKEGFLEGRGGLSAALRCPSLPGSARRREHVEPRCVS